MNKLMISILFITLFTGCIGKEDILVTSAPENINSCGLLLESDLLDFAKEGRLKGIQVALDTTREHLENVYGKPDQIGTDHGPYLNYDNCYFYIWDNSVGVIGIKLPYSVNEIKDIMGEPDYEGEPDAGFDEYVLGYQASEYYLFFKYRNEDATSGVLRFKKT